MQVVIRLENVSKHYGEFVAINSMSLNVYTGEFLTILGPSGSGKTTLLRVLGGHLQPSSGHIYFKDKDVTNIPANCRDTSTVFQEYALFPHMTVSENIEYGLKVRGINKPKRKRKATQLLNLVKLEGFENRRIKDLSGGEKQRVALARSLSIEPIVLLLDEPLGSLDEKLRKEMQGELKKLHDILGATFVYVTHVQEEALTMSDRIGILNKGQLQQIDSPQVIYERPRTRFVADFIGSANVLVGKVETIDSQIIRVNIKNELYAVSNQGSPVIVRVGDEVAFCVRPNRIKIEQEISSQDNQFEGQVDFNATLYKGRTYEYKVVLSNGIIIRVEVGNQIVSQNFTKGKVRIGWSAQDTVVVQ